MKEVAQRCGVSAMTVSLVLSGSMKIPEKTRNRILNIVKEMGYRKHAIASSLAKNSTMTLAVVVPPMRGIFMNPFFSEALSGIYDTAQEMGYTLLLKVASPEFISGKEYLHLFQEKRIDGMLYMAATSQDTYLEEFLKFNLPLMQVGSYFPNLPLPYTTGDDAMGGYLATKHLLTLGHKKIAMITGSRDVISARDRHEGYKKAMQESGLRYEQDMVEPADFNEHTGYLAMQRLLEKKAPAVFCGNDLMAIGAIRAVKRSGLQVPKDVAIAGMDNIPLGEMISPSLTTVTYDGYSFAKRGVQKLAEIIKVSQRCPDSLYKEVNAGEISEMMPVELLIRESCGYKASVSDSLNL